MGNIPNWNMEKVGSSARSRRSDDMGEDRGAPWGESHIKG